MKILAFIKQGLNVKERVRKLNNREIMGFLPHQLFIIVMGLMTIIVTFTARLWDIELLSILARLLAGILLISFAILAILLLYVRSPKDEWHTSKWGTIGILLFSSLFIIGGVSYLIGLHLKDFGINIGEMMTWNMVYLMILAFIIVGILEHILRKEYVRNLALFASALMITLFIGGRMLEPQQYIDFYQPGILLLFAFICARYLRKNKNKNIKNKK